MMGLPSKSPQERPVAPRKLSKDTAFPKGPPSASLGTFAKVLLTAAAGQYFLAQSGKTYSLWAGLALFGISLWLARPWFAGKTDPGSQRPLSPRVETLCFLGILALAAFLRIFRLDSMPPGMHTDQGLMGQSALRVAFEGWRPFFEVLNYYVPEITLYYLMGGWFYLLGSSYFTFHLFFVLFSLAAFPFVYLVFRRLAGPRTALFALFFLAVMRWHLIFSRNGFPTIQVPFYLFATLYFWLRWVQDRKAGPLLASALFCGLGLYTYQTFKSVPLLMALLALYEYFKSGRKLQVRRDGLVFFFLVVLLASPLVYYMVHQGSVGNRERELFIGKAVMEQKSLLPVLKVWEGTALMFNREGETNPRHNIPGHRMLDDITAVLFILGLGLAFRRFRERQGFYPLAGMGVLSLTCLLSTDPAHASRLLALTPFVALVSAEALSVLWGQTAKMVKEPFGPRLALGLVLSAAAFQNAYAYFVQEAQNHDCWQGYGPEQTYIGRSIEDSERSQPGRFNYYLAASLFGNNTISYLAYPARNRLFPLKAQDMEGQNPFLSGRDAVFILEEGHNGFMDFLRTLFPHGQEKDLKDWDGRTLVDWLQVPQADLEAFHGWRRGLKGTYIQAAQWTSPPLTSRWDPFLNFTYKGDFPFTDYPPFRARWTGTLEAARAGSYQFQVLTTDSAQLWLDGKPVPLEKPVALRAGPHTLHLDFEKDGGDSLALHLIWKKPGDGRWEVVPAAAFGKTDQMRILNSKF